MGIKEQQNNKIQLFNLANAKKTFETELEKGQQMMKTGEETFSHGVKNVTQFVKKEYQSQGPDIELVREAIETEVTQKQGSGLVERHC